MLLTHEGATFNAARKTVNLLQANRVNYLATQIIDLNQIDHICPYLGHYQLCRKETVPFLCYTVLAICKVWVEGYIPAPVVLVCGTGLRCVVVGYLSL